jgi:hypothetical protein
MSAPFVSQLRTRGASLALAEPGAGTITLRVSISDIWDTVRVTARPDTVVAEVKQRVVAKFFPENPYVEDFVLKLRGWEVLDEGASLQEAGVGEGSILLLAYRRRRAVK